MYENGIEYFSQIGTGNYNEKTAGMYTDFSIMTANTAIGADATVFFQNMCLGNALGVYRELLVALNAFKQPILDMIDGEARRAKAGVAARIVMKLNSLTDRDVIDRLSAASCAGVPVLLIVRGICCLVPGIQNRTENIRVRSIVGRFLEHARVHCFGEGEEEKCTLVRRT